MLQTITTGAHPRYRLIGSRHEVMFRDGSAIGLHLVQGAGGVPELLLRAVRVDFDWLVFDLRHVVNADIERDIKRLEARDRAGIVFYTLRLAFPTAQACLQAIAEQALVRQADVPVIAEAA